MVNIAIKQQYCNTVQPQLSSDRFTQDMTLQTWRLKSKHMTSRLFLTLVIPFRWLIFRNIFHAVHIAIKQQYCKTVRPQLSSDRFTQDMTLQTWRLKSKHMTSWLFFTLVLPFRWLIFRNIFHAVNIAIKQQQYNCNTVRPQLNSERSGILYSGPINCVSVYLLDIWFICFFNV